MLSFGYLISSRQLRQYYLTTSNTTAMAIVRKTVNPVNLWIELPTIVWRQLIRDFEGLYLLCYKLSIFFVLCNQLETLKDCTVFNILSGYRSCTSKGCQKTSLMSMVSIYEHIYLHTNHSVNNKLNKLNNYKSKIKFLLF